MEFISAGKITFILDGFDELSPTIDEKRIDKNIQIVQAIAKKGNKVVLTSRHTYLSKNSEKKFFEGHDLFEIIDFDENQIREFIDKNFKVNHDGQKKAKMLELIKKPELGEFTRRPLLLQIIYDDYENIEKQSIVNPATIFRYLTERWIIFDVNKRRDLSEPSKNELKNHRQRISEVLALQVNDVGTNSISKKEMIDRVQEEFESDPEHVKMYLDRYYHDAKNSTFLIRQQSEDNEDTFSFTYKSIMEYLVARRIVIIISNCDKEALIKYSAQIKTPETFAFIDYITDVDWAIKPHIIPELALNLGDTKASYHDHLDRSNFLNETIEYAKTKSKDSNPQCNPKIANLAKHTHLIWSSHNIQ